jgi:hypothetical protein
MIAHAMDTARTISIERGPEPCRALIVGSIFRRPVMMNRLAQETKHNANYGDKFRSNHRGSAASVVRLAMRPSAHRILLAFLCTAAARLGSLVVRGVELHREPPRCRSAWSAFDSLGRVDMQLPTTKW